LYHYVRYKLISGWSPEQISGRMKVENKPYYVCHETIYQYIYKERQGKDWYAYLTRAKPKRGKRKGRKAGSGKYFYIRPIHFDQQRLWLVNNRGIGREIQLDSPQINMRILQLL